MTRSQLAAKQRGQGAAAHVGDNMPALSGLEAGKAVPVQKAANPDEADGGDVVERVTDSSLEARNRSDQVWRWTTIGLSCAGGLASGWLGSNISDQYAGLFKSDVQTIIGKASQRASHATPPVPVKINGDMLMGGSPGLAAGHVTGKTDRAAPMDDNLCTVLELDRGTGLTLAKPCKPIEKAEFNSTLGKADLLAKPRP